MIKKFFVQIVFISIIVCFFGLNFDTKISIRFWFNDVLTLENISLFIALAAAYMLGLITVIPFFIAKNIKKRKSDKQLDIEE